MNIHAMALAGGALCLAVMAAESVAAQPAADRRPLQTVPSMDLQRYAGTWYEIARLPNRFQRTCTGSVKATYTLREDGKIGVLNECREASGKLKSARGTARIASSSGPNTKLKVTFFWPFSGDYWVIDLDPEYQWAVVGEPGRRYFWILSRAAQMERPVLDQILERAQAQSYELGRLIFADHPDS
jgi:apolipoprotein D and lipocalin family protein